MDEQTKGLLAEYLKKLLEAIEQGASFAADQIPLVIQEKLQYDFWAAMFYFFCGVLWLILGLVTFVIWYKAHKRWLDDHSDYDDPIHFFWIFAFAPSLIIGAINICSQGETMLKIYLAPRLYILEWLRSSLQ